MSDEAAQSTHGSTVDLRELNVISERVIGAAMEVHRILGPGLLESAYARCLSHELGLRQVPFRRQVPVRVDYKGITLSDAFRADLVVEDAVLVELKATETVHPLHQVQLLTYLRLSRLRLGLLINFHTPVLWRGVRRVINCA